MKKKKEILIYNCPKEKKGTDKTVTIAKNIFDTSFHTHQFTFMRDLRVVIVNENIHVKVERG
jgi:hypothetical protein